MSNGNLRRSHHSEQLQQNAHNHYLMGFILSWCRSLLSLVLLCSFSAPCLQSTRFCGGHFLPFLTATAAGIISIKWRYFSYAVECSQRRFFIPNGFRLLKSNFPSVRKNDNVELRDHSLAHLMWAIILLVARKLAQVVRSMPNGEHAMRNLKGKSALKEIIRTKWNRSNGRWRVRWFKNTILWLHKYKTVSPPVDINCRTTAHKQKEGNN